MLKAELGKFKKFDAKNYKVGIVAAQFNADITTELLKFAKKMLTAYRVLPKNIEIVYVPGSVEIPVVLQAMAEKRIGKGSGKNKYDCLVALGAVIRGETTHYDYVCKMVSEGVMRVALDYNIPVGFGVLTVENKKQARERLGVGGGAVEAALQTAKIIQEL
ncbi:MAG: 6,7-dimethyl-8-ribityllumazine synthase [Candidatus Magasanikbacteria bacterium]|nr:6,7-dimethyl-8-ribityllumazine synthase [Candidatus Magasanikbacteria bacterium]